MRAAKNLILFLIAATLFSCSKQGRSINPVLKNYFDYQAGSYFVFWDSLQNYEDSIPVGYYGEDPVSGSVDETVYVQDMEEYYSLGFT